MKNYKNKLILLVAFNLIASLIRKSDKAKISIINEFLQAALNYKETTCVFRKK